MNKTNKSLSQVNLWAHKAIDILSKVNGNPIKSNTSCVCVEWEWSSSTINMISGVENGQLIKYALVASIFNGDDSLQ